jgi:hypothetical protein
MLGCINTVYRASPSSFGNGGSWKFGASSVAAAVIRGALSRAFGQAGGKVGGGRTNDERWAGVVSAAHGLGRGQLPRARLEKTILHCLYAI